MTPIQQYDLIWIATILLLLIVLPILSGIRGWRIARRWHSARSFRLTVVLKSCVVWGAIGAALVAPAMLLDNRLVRQEITRLEADGARIEPIAIDADQFSRMRISYSPGVNAPQAYRRFRAYQFSVTTFTARDIAGTLAVMFIVTAGATFLTGWFSLMIFRPRSATGGFEVLPANV